MAETPAKRSTFPIGRLIAVALAIGLAGLVYLQWQQAELASAGGPNSAETLPGLGVPQSVTECAARRIEQVDQAEADGLLSGEAAELSRNRARTLCRQRN